MHIPDRFYKLAISCTSFTPDVQIKPFKLISLWYGLGGSLGDCHPMRRNEVPPSLLSFEGYDLPSNLVKCLQNDNNGSKFNIYICSIDYEI